MFILAVGMLARAAVGPAERLLNMLGERKQCAFIYARRLRHQSCAVRDPHSAHRHRGRGVATSSAIVVESYLLYLVARRRLGFHVFILGGGIKHVVIPGAPNASGPLELAR